MSEPTNRLEIVVVDPPLLRSLKIGDDHEVNAEISTAYHVLLEGSKRSPFVMSGVLLSAIGKAILARLDAILAKTSASPNGSKEPGEGRLTTPQFQALKNLIESQSALLKALPAERGGEDNPALSAFLEDYRFEKSQKTKRRLWDQIGKWSIIVTVVAAIVASACLLTYLLTWRQIQIAANRQVERVIASQPFNDQVPAFLASHHGKIFKGPLTQNQDHGETEGIIIMPGDLKLSKSWVSTDGATVIPIQ
jgi:hypothetical protein